MGKFLIFFLFTMVMALLKQYPDSVIESWSTGKLGALYMSSFAISRKHDPSESSQLERVTAILAARDFKERLGVRSHMEAALSSYVAQEDYERASLWRDMILHYNMHVLG